MHAGAAIGMADGVDIVNVVVRVCYLAGAIAIGVAVVIE